MPDHPVKSHNPESLEPRDALDRALISRADSLALLEGDRAKLVGRVLDANRDALRTMALEEARRARMRVTWRARGGWVAVAALLGIAAGAWWVAAPSIHEPDGPSAGAGSVARRPDAPAPELPPALEAESTLAALLAGAEGGSDDFEAMNGWALSYDATSETLEGEVFSVALAGGLGAADGGGR